jgi:hypothetical protein
MSSGVASSARARSARKDEKPNETRSMSSTTRIAGPSKTASNSVRIAHGVSSTAPEAPSTENHVGESLGDPFALGQVSDQSFEGRADVCGRLIAGESRDAFDQLLDRPCH